MYNLNLETSVLKINLYFAFLFFLLTFSIAFLNFVWFAHLAFKRQQYLVTRIREVYIRLNMQFAINPFMQFPGAGATIQHLQEIELFWEYQTLLSAGLTEEYIWSISSVKRNRLAHALNGNIFTEAILMLASYTAWAWFLVGQHAFYGTSIGQALTVGKLLLGLAGFFAGPVGPGTLPVIWAYIVSGQVSGVRILTTLSSWLITWLGPRLTPETLAVWRPLIRGFTRAAIILALVVTIVATPVLGVYVVSLAITTGYLVLLFLLPNIILVGLAALASLPDTVNFILTGHDQPAVLNMLGVVGHILGRRLQSLWSLMERSLDVATDVVMGLAWFFFQPLRLVNRAYATFFEAGWYVGDAPGYMPARTFLIANAFFFFLLPFSTITIVFAMIAVLIMVMTTVVALALPFVIWLNPDSELVQDWKKIGSTFVEITSIIYSDIINSTRAKLYMPKPEEIDGAARLAYWFWLVGTILLPFVAILHILVLAVRNLRLAARFALSIPKRIGYFIVVVITIMAIPDGVFALGASIWEEAYAYYLKDAQDPNGLYWMVRAYLFNLPSVLFFGFEVLKGRVDLVDDVLDTDKEVVHDPALPDISRLSAVYRTRIINLTRRTVLRFMNRLDQFKLPEFISAQYSPPTVEGLRSTYQLLHDVGIAVNQTFLDSLKEGGDPTGNPYLMEFQSLKGRILASTNYKLGFRNIELGQHPWVEWLDQSLKDMYPAFVSSMSFTGVIEEIRSTARYFDTPSQQKDVDGPTFKDIAESAFQGVKAQFGNSRLTSIADIFKQWYKHKNYSFGFGVGKEKKFGGFKQYTREQVVSIAGGKQKFIAAMEKLFYHGSRLNMPSSVFTKEETLKPSKAQTRSVRTVVGIAFTHYVRQLVTNFYPDHNYHPWDVPGKIGMAINGVNFDRIARTVARHENIFAGDMTAFDSTQLGVVLRLVAAVRKAGYHTSRDYDKICELIDVTYESLLHQPMGFKNFGVVAEKAQGFTTGAGSTGADNTLALLINYLFAWRMTTGLRAREFYHYNTLVNLGDDHILGWDNVFGWNPDRAAAAMAQLGTKMRNEAPDAKVIPVPGTVKPSSLPDGDWRKSDLKFLSKVWIPLEGKVHAELLAAGVSGIRYPSAHDPRRLFGKMTGLMRATKVEDTFRSYSTGIDYLSLCAHNSEIYVSLARTLAAIRRSEQDKWLAHGIRPSQIRTIPSYNSIIKAWYSDSGKFDFDLKESFQANEEEEPIILLNHDDAFASIIRWIADAPTILSPRYLNTAWADWLQTKLSSRLSWPLQFIALANGSAEDPTLVGHWVARTPYAFLRSPALQGAPVPFGTLILRHWVAMVCFRFFQRRRTFSIFDLVRLGDNLISNYWFILSGSLSTIVIELDMHLLETFTVVFLSYLNLRLPFEPTGFRMPTLSLGLGRMLSAFFRFISPSGSVDMQPFLAICERLGRWKSTALVSAPTATGKTTRMMLALRNHTMQRVVVIIPKHLAVVGVGQYMQSVYPNARIGIQTEGHRAADTDTLIYTTAQSFFMSVNLQSAPIVVLDEAHVMEPHYITLRNYLASPENPSSVMYLTATPPDELVYDEQLAVPAVSSFSVTTIERSVNTYAAYEALVRRYLLSVQGSERVLVFVTTIASMLKIGGGLKGACFVHSKQNVVDEGAWVYFTTSSGDNSITFPRITTVFSCRHDISVSMGMTDVNEGIKPDADDGFPNDVRSEKPIISFFPLTQQGITQRRGRGGRDCDSLFFLIDVLKIKLIPRTFTIMDYLSALSPAVEQAYQYIPPEVQATAPPRVRQSLSLWRVAQGSVNYSRISAILKLFLKHKKKSKTLAQFIESFGDELARKRAWDFDPNLDDFMEDDEEFENLTKLRNSDKDNDGDSEPKRDRGDGLGNQPPPPPPIDPGLLYPQYQPAPHRFRRINVPGNRAQCGVYTMVGIIQTALGLYPSFDSVLAQASHVAGLNQDVEPGTDLMAWFNYTVLETVLFYQYRIRVRLTLGGAQWPMTGDVRRMPGPIYEIYLNHEGGHYNYLGNPLSDLVMQNAVDLYLAERPVFAPVRNFLQLPAPAQEDPYWDPLT